LVERWAPRLSLVARTDLPRLGARHIDDSLRLLPLLAEVPPGPCADVGSGAGLPGVPLALADRSRRWRLIEPRRQRAAFLEEVVRSLDLDAEVVAMTAEEAATRRGLAAAHSLVTARALAKPATALALCVPLVATGGLAATFVGGGDPIPPGAEAWGRGVAIVRHDGWIPRGG